jgi:hypothetical protein
MQHKFVNKRNINIFVNNLVNLSKDKSCPN